MNNILYRVGDNLYINLTNRCPCACTFCLRQSTDTVGASDSLWLKEEPDFDTVKAEFSSKNLEEYGEVVFCGFGEPTERLALLLEVADFVKAEYHKPVRLNTNGLGDLINGRKIAPELQNRVDTVSITLNTPDRDDYLKLVGKTLQSEPWPRTGIRGFRRRYCGKALSGFPAAKRAVLRFS